MLSEVFWSFLITSIIGFSIAICRLAYKSKCQTIEIGLTGIRIVRDTTGEEKLDDVQRQNSNKEEEQKV